MHYNQAMKLRQKQSPTDAEALQEKVLLLQSQMQAQEIKNQHDANVLQEMVLALQSQVQALEISIYLSNFVWHNNSDLAAVVKHIRLSLIFLTKQKLSLIKLK